MDAALATAAVHLPRATAAEAKMSTAGDE